MYIDNVSFFNNYCPFKFLLERNGTEGILWSLDESNSEIFKIFGYITVNGEMLSLSVI